MKAPAFWSARHPTLFARALSPLGAIYGAATANRMARAGERAQVPVVCVGNFVAGGAGKTPAAIALAAILREMGEAPAFLSRGYGGAGRDATIEVDLARHDFLKVGDEPLLLAAAGPCFVDAERARAARAAIAKGASVLILDDGLQNPGLAKDISFALIDGGAGLGNGFCVPAGPLRAPLARQLPFVSAVVLVDGASEAGAGAREAISGKPILNAMLRPDPDVAATLRNRSVLAFAGIGRPEKFFATLRALGANVAEAREYGDHHRYSAAEIDGLLAEADRLSLAPVTTQKDFVRLDAAQAAKIVALPVRLEFEAPEAARQMLASALARRHSE